MALYAIGDLHFSPNNSKPMDIFGWENHKEKILKDWQEKLSDDDIIIIAGDTSWALKFEDARENLDEINNLKGKKIIIKGNHDYWWQSLSKMQKHYPNITFIHNNCYFDEKYIVFGTRGWDVPGSFNFKEDEQKIYDREIVRLRNSINSYKGDFQGKEIIVAMHYPPVNERKDRTIITDIMQEIGAKHFIYGHLHGKDSFLNILEGEYMGTCYHLVSADYMEFKIKKIID